MMTPTQLINVRKFFGYDRYDFAIQIGADPQYQAMLERGTKPVTKAYYSKLKYQYVLHHGKVVLSNGDRPHLVDNQIDALISRIAA
jgi:hypothetical protein